MTDSQPKYNDQLQQQLAGANLLLFIGAIVLITGLLILTNDLRWWRQTGVWTDASVSYLLSYYEIDRKPLSWESPSAPSHTSWICRSGGFSRARAV